MGCLSIYIFQIRISSCFEEEFNNLGVSFLRSEVECGAAFIGDLVDIGTPLDQQGNDLGSPVGCSFMERSPLENVDILDIGSLIQK